MAANRSTTVLRCIVVMFVALLLTACGKEKMPNRDFIPQLRARLNDLQLAVKERDRARIDSILSVQILDLGEDSDSLLKFVYGPDGSFAFERFGDAEIFYTDDKARIDAYIMDSTATQDRPITFTLIREHGMWLLKRFEAKTDTVKSMTQPQ